MKLAASNIAWDAADDVAVADLLVAEGFEGVEIAPTRRWPRPLEATDAEMRDYREFWESRGLRIVAMQALLFGRPDLQLFGSDESRRELLQYLEGMFRMAAALGARALVFGSPKNRERGRLDVERATNIATEFFARTAARAEAHGVVLCIEPNPPEYGCDFITTTAEAVELCYAVGRLGFAVQGDLGAITMVGDDPSILATNGSNLAHFHISEPNLVETGTGGADHAAAARALADGAYGGWRSIEMRKSVDGPAIDAIARAVRVVRRYYAS